MSGTTTVPLQRSGVVNKVWAATGGSAIAGSIATIVLWYLDTNHILSPDPLPSNINSAITTVFSTLAALGLGYQARPGGNEVVALDPAGRPKAMVEVPAVLGRPGGPAETAGAPGE